MTKSHVCQIHSEPPPWTLLTGPRLIIFIISMTYSYVHQTLAETYSFKAEMIPNKIYVSFVFFQQVITRSMCRSVTLVTCGFHSSAYARTVTDCVRLFSHEYFI